MQSDNLHKIKELKKDIKTIQDKIKECKEKGKSDDFDIEMTLMTEIPQLYSDYPWLIKRLSKSQEDAYLVKFIASLESVMKGEKTLASVELALGMELKQQFIDPVVSNKTEKKD
jgi:hypothetical protein